VDGLLEIDDVDPVPRAEYEGFHFGVPSFGLMTEVDTGFKKLSHGYVSHFFLLNGLVFSTAPIFPETDFAKKHRASSPEGV
jgi:hypothetical protein